MAGLDVRAAPLLETTLAGFEQRLARAVAEAESLPAPTAQIRHVLDALTPQERKIRCELLRRRDALNRGDYTPEHADDDCRRILAGEDPPFVLDDRDEHLRLLADQAETERALTRSFGPPLRTPDGRKRWGFGRSPVSHRPRTRASRPREPRSTARTTRRATRSRATSHGPPSSADSSSDPERVARARRGLGNAAAELRAFLVNQGDDRPRPDLSIEDRLAREWMLTAAALVAENLELRRWLTSLLWWIAEREELLEFARAAIAERWPEEAS